MPAVDAQAAPLVQADDPIAGLRSAAAITAAVLMFAGGCGPAVSPTAVTRTPATLNGHRVMLDGSDRLVSWSPQDSAYGTVVDLAWRRLEEIRRDHDRLYLRYSTFNPSTMAGGNWPHNPAGLFAMLADSGLGYYSYSGDAAALTLVREALDQEIEHGTTPASGYAWPSMPYASSEPGSTTFAGADDKKLCGGCGTGDGLGVIEPDKAGEIGLAYVHLFEVLGDRAYLDASVAAANTLARTERTGNASSSPWPFRVEARSGRVRYDYTANALGPVMLFDELLRIGAGDAAAYRLARLRAWNWLMTYPFRNQRWAQYFEDIPNYSDPGYNRNQYIPLRLAEYMIQHPEFDPSWRTDAAALIAWVKATFGADTRHEAGVQWGATVMSEQTVDMDKMGSHTARFGAANALYARATGDRSAADTAFRSFNWATYMCAPDGLVMVGPQAGYWFSDGYGDYVRNFLIGMAAQPDWAPVHQTHLLQTTSIVVSVSYGAQSISYRTYDLAATDELRLAFAPRVVTAGGKRLFQTDHLGGDGYTVTDLGQGDFVVEVRHTAARDVTVGAS